jgi:phage FluMu protein gp41
LQAWLKEQDKLVPDIEGDLGYPQLPQLTEEEVKTLENFDKKTIKTKLSKQIKDKRKAAKRLKKQAKEGVNYEIVVEMPHENE